MSAVGGVGSVARGGGIDAGESGIAPTGGGCGVRLVGVAVGAEAARRGSVAPVSSNGWTRAIVGKSSMSAGGESAGSVNAGFSLRSVSSPMSAES
jgi:hypothetical protein